MKFSICIPTHRLDQRLSNTLRSVEFIKHSGIDVDLCLYVNGVADIQDFPLTDFVRVKVDVNPTGPSRAKNNAIKMAKHEWVVLLDSDDFLVPSALKQYESVIESYPGLDVLFELSMLNIVGPPGVKRFAHPNLSDYKTFYENSKPLMQRAACGRPVLFRKSSFIPFDESCLFAEERKLAVDYWNAGRAIHVLGTCSYVYNWNGNGVTGGYAMSELPEEKRNYFQHFLDRTIRQIQEPKIVHTNSFLIPNEEDDAAIKKFIEWETKVGV